MSKKVTIYPFIALLIIIGFITGCAVQPATGVAKPQTEVPLISTVIEDDAGDQSLPRDEVLYKLLLGEIAGLRGNIDVAINNMLAVTKTTDNAQVAERTARVCLYAQNNECAQIAVKRWVALDPDSEVGNQFAALLSARNGERKNALNYFNRVLNLNAAYIDQGFVTVATLLSKDIDQKLAEDIMASLVRNHNKNPYALYAEALLLTQFKEYRKARDLLTQSLLLKPDLMSAIVLRVTVTTELDGVDMALRELDAQVAKYPDSDAIRMAYGRTLVSAKRYEAAIEQFVILQEKSPRETELLYMLGMLTLDINRLDDAERYFMTLLQEGKRVDDVNYYLGRIAENRRQYKEAITYYTRINQGDYRLDAQIRIAQMLGRLGRVDQAREHLQQLQAMTSDPALRIRFYLAEATMLREVPLYDASIDLLTKGLDEFPDDFDLLYARAITAERAGRLDVVEQDFRLILSQEPDNAEALNALGYTLADRTNRYQEAYELIAKAMKLKPDNAAITDSFGWVLYRLGRYEEALVYLHRAFSLESDPEIAAHLGEVLWVSGDQNEARAVLKNALAINPDHEALLKVIRQFKP